MDGIGQSGWRNQKPPQPIEEPFAPREGGLTFPHDEDAPAEAAQGADGAPVACGVAVDLDEPISAIRRGNPASAASVAMPEAAMDENGELAAGNFEIELVIV